MDRRAYIGLERVRRVVELEPKQYPYEKVGEAIEDVFRKRVVDDAAARNESTAKHCLVALVQLLPVPHDIAAVIRLVRHHDDDGVAGRRVDSSNHGPSEPVRRVVLDGTQ